MIIDARTLDEGVSIESDLCIVGAGTAGIVLARELIGTSLQVCLLESGGREPEKDTQSLAFGENVGVPYFPLDTARERVFGGCSTRWNIPIGSERLGVRIRPLDPIDFEERPWVPFSGWPFSKSQLDPYYDRAQAVCQVCPSSFKVADWSLPDQPTLPLKGDVVDTILYKFARRDPLARDYPREVAAAGNITTYLHANVLEIATDANARQVTHLRVATLEGKQFSVRARFFVVAVGGIETPRLLLLSNKVCPKGLGNAHDLVGRFFMEHPHFWSGIFVPNHPGFFRATAFYNSIQTVNGVAVIGKLALTNAVLRREKLLNQNIQFIWSEIVDPSKYPLVTAPAVRSLRVLLSAMRHRKPISDAAEHWAEVFKGLDEIAASAWRKIRGRFGLPRVPAIIFANMMEQIPNPESRVLLGPDRDLFGQPRVQLDWRITKQDIRSAIRTHEIVGETFQRAGLGRFFQQLREETPPTNTEGGYHHMGTTRMHVEPDQGVVDPDCRVHGIGNLFIAGPSVFPTVGYANPVLTIVALAVRLSDHLKKLLC